MPTAVWEDVSMDFFTRMPLSKGFTVVLVVVDRFSKDAHFAPLPTNFNAHKVAEVFMETIVKLHRIPKTIMSDCDPIFVSKFWTQLFKLSGTQLNHSIAYHPQTDGQTEVVICGLEQYLRAMVANVLANGVPLAIIPYPPGSLKVAAVDDVLIERYGLLLEFNVGDQVLVKLQPYRQLTLAKRLSNKFAKRYYGPYEVLERVVKVAYRLALSVNSKMHLVFHVSNLKPFSGRSSSFLLVISTFVALIFIVSMLIIFSGCFHLHCCDLLESSVDRLLSVISTFILEFLQWYIFLDSRLIHAFGYTTIQAFTANSLLFDIG
ncbi:ty3-gypsy retrotransposon protein [Tanacetum coccineum]